jgi:hypothetical protein
MTGGRATARRRILHIEQEASVARSGPPAYAWDWFARQRLLWREARSRLAASATPAASRYAALDSRSEVVAALRSDYPRDEVVRSVVHQIVGEVAFLSRLQIPFSQLGVASAPRGMRWWWTALTGEELDAPVSREPAPRTPGRQLTLDDVHEGYGD